MKFFKYFIFLLAATGWTSSAVYGQVIGQETTFNRDLRTRDDQAVREFIDSKENIPVKDKAKNLEISGDVRFEYTNLREKGVVVIFDNVRSPSSYSSGYHVIPDEAIVEVDGKDVENVTPPVKAPKPSLAKKYRNLRGGSHVDTVGLPISQNDFDVEFNLKLKYVYENAWANAHLQFDNPCGIKRGPVCERSFPIFNSDGSMVEDTGDTDARLTAKGSGDGVAINLKRAFLGYNVWADGVHRFDIEAGRRKLSDVFDSEVQFTARFDGLLFKYATSIGEISDFYWNTGAFVIDERVNHFGWVTEFGFLNVFDSGLDIKYSFIDWRKFGKNRCFARNPYGTAFANSQVTLEYYFKPELFCKTYTAQLYGGFLVNQAANKNKFTRRRENLGGFVGLLLGEVNKKGDWSLDIEYIYVQAQAVPDFDVGSIGRGNILDEYFYEIYYVPPGDNYSSLSDTYSLSSGSESLVGYFPRRGNANFKGLRIDALYALTDNLSIELAYEFSHEITRKLGGPHKYTDFEIEAIYAF